MKPSSLNRTILGTLAAGLLAFGAWPDASAATLCNADDLRGTWVFNFNRVVLGQNAAGPLFYVQVSMGGTASAGTLNIANSTVEVLSGGSLQESPERTVTGGFVTVQSDGAVHGTFTLVDPNAQTSSIMFDSDDVTGTGTLDTNHNGTDSTFAAVTIRRGLQSDKNSIPNDRNYGTPAATLGYYVATTPPTGFAGRGSSGIDSMAASYAFGAAPFNHPGMGTAMNLIWSATKISDNEVKNGNNAGQACFLRTVRR